MTTVRIIISLLAIVLALLLYASVERFWIQVNRFTILTSQARSNSTGLKLLQISDLHLQHFGWYEKQVLRRINEHQPDVVVITGDFIKKREFLVDTNSVSRREAFSAVKLFVRGIHAPMGIYACRGNNDITDDKEVSDALLALLQRENVSVLCNQGTFVQKNNVDYYLMGIDFPWFFPKQSADFAVVEENENHVLQAKSSEKNSYSHLLIGDNRSTWMNYEFCGSFRVSQPDKGGIGFTFYSQFDRGY
ncbi:MAG: hypothetical protein EHM72_18520, partial [Calditrichaeota bacterium]